MQELLDLIYADLKAAKQQHLATGSYAEHASLDKFADGATDRFDKLAESLRGIGEKLVPEADILGRLKQSYTRLTEMRQLADGEEPVLAQFDELQAIYLRAIYRLENLK